MGELGDDVLDVTFVPVGSVVTGAEDLAGGDCFGGMGGPD